MDSRVKYLYLKEKEWATTWVNGGLVPINLASFYKSDIREGTNTPDEVLQRRLSGVDEAVFNKIFGVGSGGSTTIKVGNLIINDKLMGTDIEFNQKQEDGLILSFCNEFNPEIAKRLGKKACVKIFDIKVLLYQIDIQLGIQGVSKKCEYTRTFQRNHFLKSVDDSWQNEFRLFWPHNEPVSVSILKDTGEEIIFI